MKNVTTQFKNKIKEFGREIKAEIVYELNNEEIVLTSSEINIVNLSYDGGILKSIMKKLEIDSNVDIAKDTEINFKFGLKVNSSYEWIDYGTFIVESSEKKEDTNSYRIIAYDYMLKFMKDYVYTEFSFPLTVNDYIKAICDLNNVVFDSYTSTYANKNMEISRDCFIDAEGNFLGYTYRDALDQFAEVVGGTIYINEDDALEIKYVTDTSDYINESSLKDINVNFGEKFGPVNSVVLSRSAESDNVYLRDEESVQQNGLCEIKIIDNQIMNDNNRSDFLPAILDKVQDIEFYLNDYKSTGILYYEIFDKYNVVIGENTYSCIMMNDEIIIEQGIVENVYTEIPEQAETDYQKADKTDRKINQAYSIVDKQALTITNLVSQTTQNQQLNNERILELQERTNAVQQTINSQQATIEVMQRDIIQGQETLKNNLVTIDINGIQVSTNTSQIQTLMTNEKFVIKSGNRILAYFGYDDSINSTKAEMDNLTVTNYFIAGNHRVEKFTSVGERRTGWFYIG